MELRHYTEALECINESLEYAGDKVPDLYFRRAQAVCYNKYSVTEDLDKAMEDINKAISLKKELIYTEFQDKLKGIQVQRKNQELENIISTNSVFN
jgi:tetratricopeptide (TPR) repeat protein